MLILALDPGEHSGWCLMDQAGNPHRMGTAKGAELYAVLEKEKDVIDTIVCESYRVFSHKLNAHAQSDLKTSRMIGAVEHFSSTHKIKLVMQPPTIKKAGYGWLRITPPSKHSESHVYDAFAHGFYYCVRQGTAKIKTAKDVGK